MSLTGFKIVEAMISLADDRAILYGGYIRDSLTEERVPKDLDVIMSESGAMRLSKAIEKLGGTVAKVKGDYETLRLSVSLAGEMCNIDCTAPEMYNWCDFTCNNLQLTSDGTMSLRCNRPNLDLLRCIRDINAKKLVPMCPQEWLLTFETANDRQYMVNLLQRAMKMMRRGWTLQPHLNGEQLHFVATKINPQVEQKCPVCQEAITKSLTAVDLKCNHSFHIKCLKKLIHSNGPSSYKCPICRQNIKF